MAPKTLDEHIVITQADIHAALAYYYDHQDEIDAQIKEDAAFAEAMRRRTPSLLAQKLAERELQQSKG